MLFPYLSILLAFIAVILFLLSARQKRRAGIPTGKIIYVDKSQWARVEKPLFSQALSLTGRPDYLVKQRDQIVPVEVKSGHAPQQPYDSHIYQLMAYCLLVESEYGVRPSHGIIHYSDRSFKVDFSSELERSTQTTIQEMQGHSVHSQVNRSHEDGNRCRHCGYRSICDQALRI